MSARWQARSRFSCHGAGRRDPRRRGPRAGQACVPRPVQVADEELKKTKASRRSSRLGADRVGGQQGGGAEGLLAPPPVGDQVPADTPTPLSQRVSGVFAAVQQWRGGHPPRSRARPTRRRSRKTSSRPPPAATSRPPSSSGYAHASVSESVWRVCCSSIMARRACRSSSLTSQLSPCTTEMPRPTLAADAAESRRRRAPSPPSADAADAAVAADSCRRRPRLHPRLRHPNCSHFHETAAAVAVAAPPHTFVTAAAVVRYDDQHC